MQRRRRTAVLAAAALIVSGLAAGWAGIEKPWKASPSADTATQPEAVTPAEQPVADGRRSITVLGAGDVLPHPEMWHQARQDGKGAYDFLPMMAGVASTVSGADLALCHLEPTVAAPTGPFIGFPRFSVPPQTLDAVKQVGFDGCSTSSNHALDHGEEGVARTLDALDSAGIGHSGTYKSAAEAIVPKIYDVKGVKLAHLSYSKHFNGFERPAGKAWIANQIDVNAILTAAKQARNAGAQIVVLSAHWGTEYQHEPDADQQTWARALIASPDIDVILGHHAHVVQPVENIGGKWVIYGMGNQIARHAEPINENREGVMMRLRFTETVPNKWTLTGLEAIPLWVDLNPDIRLVELPKALADPSTIPSKKAIYQAALDRITGHLMSRGAEQAGLKVIGTVG